MQFLPAFLALQHRIAFVVSELDRVYHFIHLFF